jgi:hypothetical protein
MGTKLQSGNLECDVDIDWNVILKIGFGKQNTTVRNRSNWFKTGSGSCGNCNKTVGSIICWQVYFTAYPTVA